MSTTKSQVENIETFKKLADQIKFCMVTTLNSENETLRSRPMTMQEVDVNNDMYFFVDTNAEMASDIEQNPGVNIAFSHPGKSSYISVIGEAARFNSMTKIKDLFNPAVKAWFPDGPEDKNLALIKVKVQTVDYWDSPSSKAVQLYAFAKSVLTGERPGEELGVHEHVDVRRQ